MDAKRKIEHRRRSLAMVVRTTSYDISKSPNSIRRGSIIRSKTVPIWLRYVSQNFYMLMVMVVTFLRFKKVMDEAQPKHFNDFNRSLLLQKSESLTSLFSVEIESRRNSAYDHRKDSRSNSYAEYEHRRHYSEDVVTYRF